MGACTYIHIETTLFTITHIKIKTLHKKLLKPEDIRPYIIKIIGL